MFRKLSTLALAIFVLVGCANKPKGPQNPLYKMLPSKSSESNLIIFRKSKFVGGAASPDIFINGTMNEGIKSGKYQSYMLPPGNYSISAVCDWSCSLPKAQTGLTIEDGEKYYLEYRAYGTGLVGTITTFGSSFVKVANEVAAKEIESLLYDNEERPKSKHRQRMENK